MVIRPDHATENMVLPTNLLATVYAWGTLPIIDVCCHLAPQKVGFRGPKVHSYEY